MRGNESPNSPALTILLALSTGPRARAAEQPLGCRSPPAATHGGPWSSRPHPQAHFLGAAGIQFLVGCWSGGLSSSPMSGEASPIQQATGFIRAIQGGRRGMAADTSQSPSQWPPG